MGQPVVAVHDGRWRARLSMMPVHNAWLALILCAASAKQPSAYKRSGLAFLRIAASICAH